jgi:hypothetical protein
MTDTTTLDAAIEAAENATEGRFPLDRDHDIIATISPEAMALAANQTMQDAADGAIDFATLILAGNKLLDTIDAYATERKPLFSHHPDVHAFSNLLDKMPVADIPIIDTSRLSHLEANAHLIAMAPDLAAEVRALIAKLLEGMERPDWFTTDEDCGWDAAISDLRLRVGLEYEV